MVTRARLKDDGTVVEVRRDGSERPLVQDVDWARIDATTEAEIAAQMRRTRPTRCAMPPPTPVASTGAATRRRPSATSAARWDPSWCAATCIEAGHDGARRVLQLAARLGRC